MKKLISLIVVLGIASCGRDPAAPGAGTDQLVVGALLSLTGPGQTLGRTSQAALQLAADDINATLASQGSATRVNVRVEDTGLNPATALERMRALATEGVGIFIGPQSSSEVAALKAFADSAGVVLISQGSTASSLSVANDNIFRLVPDDAQEGVASVALAWGNGIRAAVPLWREDAGNQGLHDSFAQLFTAHGGTVAAGAHYAPAAADFSAQLQAIHTQVAGAIAQHGAASVAVYLAGFEESAAIFAAASQDPTLAQVRWYGGDGMVQSAAVIANTAGAAFAASVSFRAPTYGLDVVLLQQHLDLVDAIEARSGYEADAFALAAYDALHLATRAYVSAGFGSVADFRAALMHEAETYSGATGAVRLNPAGDRATGDYDFYQVCAGQPAAWTRVAAYRAAAASIVTLGGC